MEAAANAQVGPVSGGEIAAAPASLLITPMPADRAKELVASIGDELSFLWDEYRVPIESQARRIELGAAEANVFSKLESGEPGMRGFIKEEVKLKVQDGLRANVGRLLSA